jgi:outer membrane receptor for ferrienterochelin and colicins
VGFFFLRALLILSFIYCQSPDTVLANSIDVPTVVIGENESGVQSPVDPFSVFKAEKVDKRKFNEPQRQTLNDLLSDQVGVDAQVYCANCGAKRLSINGLKGEHTSILVDGLPLHSAVSSFYGIDNIPVNGISDVLVMRGAGASLTNPEAIGGTINLITVDPLSDPNNYSTSFALDDSGTQKSQNHNFMVSQRGESRKWGVSVGGQFSRNETWDVDQNSVSEMPQRQNGSAFLKGRFLLGNKNDISVRLGLADLEILGGFTPPVRPNQVRPIAPQESDFIDGSVHNQYIGAPQTIMDYVDIRRLESAVTGTHYISPDVTYEWRLGHARQQQTAIYQHGFDYANIDNMIVGDTQIKWAMNDSQSLSFGSFFKDQRLRSASQILFEQRGIRPDSFDSHSLALYGQYSHVIGNSIELDFALRADQVGINWLSLDNQIDDFILAPRFQVMHEITHHLTQRFSYGLGYRTPLTFFESQHGNNERGYEVDITDLEKAHSFVYSLSLNTTDYYITGGVHYTFLENMAYGFAEPLEPIAYRNTPESYDIWVADLLVGYKLTPWWLVEGSIEFFQYEDGYTRKLPTAAIERRTQLTSTIEKGAWSHRLVGQLIGSRDLSRYANYNNHYINRNQAQEPLIAPNMQLKRQKAPSFFTIDTSLSYAWKKQVQVTAGVTNLFNFTQAGVGDNPSAWHWHFTHAHFDGLHTWGPNMGRQYFLQLSGQF